MLKIVNNVEDAKIYLYGLIIDDTDAGWLKMEGDTIGYEWPDKIKKQLDALKGKPIELHIASDGGDVAAGLTIVNLLKNHDAPVVAYIDSWAASIASVIAFSANKIIMPANSFIMIHNPKGGAWGEADYLRSVADWLTKIQDVIAKTYSNFTEKLTIDEIKDLMTKETWFTAKEAAEVFNNIQVTESNDIKAVAQYKSEFKNAPECLKPVNTVNTTTTEEKTAVEDNIKNNIKNNILEVLKEAYRL